MTPNDRPARTRRYSDEEVRTVLDRAAELESQGALVPSRVDGPTLAELERIAEEAGMDPAAVRRAAEELDDGPEPFTSVATSPPSSSFLGAPRTHRISRTVDKEIPPGTLETMVAAIEHTAVGAEDGNLTVLSRSVTWRSSKSDDKPELMVSVVIDQGETRIRIEERYRKLAAAVYGGIMGGLGCGIGFGVGMGVGLGALESMLFAVLFPIASLSGSYALARSLFRSRVEDRVRTLEELAGDLTRIAERAETQEEEKGREDEGD